MSETCKHCGLGAADGLPLFPAGPIAVEIYGGEHWLHRHLYDCIAALRAEVKRLKAESDAHWEECCNVRIDATQLRAEVDDLMATLAERDAEVTALREDAERYRWLKDHAYLWPTMPCTSVDQFERCALWLHDERVDIDAEIDAARRAGEGE